MNRGVWIAGLVLSLGGWLSSLYAQQEAWRPVDRWRQPSAQPPSPPGGVALQRPVATLGQPIKLPADFPTELSMARPGGLTPALTRVSYEESSPVGVPPLPESIVPIPAQADLVMPGWPDEPAPPVREGTEFAAERSAASPVRMEAPLAQGPVPAVVAVSRQPAPAPTSEESNGVNPWEGNLFLDPQGHVPRFSVAAEYLLWWTKSDHVPVLLTTSTNPIDGNPATSLDQFGILGQPSTVPVFGGSQLDRNPFSGFRILGSLWLDDESKEAFELGGFMLDQRSVDFSASSDHFSVLARPITATNPFTFINPKPPVLPPGSNFIQLISFPGLGVGSALVQAPSQLWGLEADYRCLLCCGSDCNGSYRVDVLGGLRYLDLRESLAITENVDLVAGPLAGSNELTKDSFQTHNQFYGVQAGVAGEYRWGRLVLDGRAKLGVGSTQQEIDIEGSQVVRNANGTEEHFVGGLLAEPSNMGRFSRDRFSVVPELTGNIGYQVTNGIRAYVGYDFMYWSSVVRSGDQVDTVVDLNQIPNFTFPSSGVVAGPGGFNRPMVTFQTRDYWAQGIHAGVELRY